MTLADFFSADYAIARDRLRAALAARGVAGAAHPIRARGPRGEPLEIDVAVLGAVRPRRALVLSSGLHGVEGYFGSALQLAWLAGTNAARAFAPAQDAAVILLHAVNPYGFAWGRRCNENNVDLNRNFVADWAAIEADAEYRDSLAIYQELHSFLNPHSPPARFEPVALKMVARVMALGARLLRVQGRAMNPLAAYRAGLARFRRALPVGQYRHPQALFYGGREQEESTRIVCRELPRLLAGAQTVLHLDFHTGLGDMGDYRLLTDEPPGSDALRWLASRLDARRIVGRGAEDATAYTSHGLMGRYLKARLAPARYCWVGAEFGTYGPLRVLSALRAEQRAHFYADPESAAYARAKAEMLEVFRPASRRWRRRVLERGLALISRALVEVE